MGKSNLKGEIMKENQANTSDHENHTKSSKFPEWIKTLLIAIIGGVVVVIAQAIFAPTTAEQVMIKESIIQKRYEACEKAIELLQRTLASVTITGESVPEEYTPTEKAPTPLEMNSAYLQLVVYNKSQTISDEFFAATGPNKIDKNDIVKFVSTVRKELGVDDKDIKYLKIRLIPPVGEDGLQDKEAKDEQKQ